MPLVLRAGEAAGVATGNAVEGLAVPVLRGEAAAVRAAERPEMAVEEESPGGWRMAAGEKLWFVDPERGRVIACRERGTFTVGERRIECTGRRLRALDP